MRPFTYLTPGDAAEAVQLLDAHAPDARVIAGGQNLLLGMKDRTDSPAVLVSLGGVPELRGVRTAESGELVIGAATTYATLARTSFEGWHSEIAAVCGNLADRPVRTMGTIGGSACSADPRYDVPALVTGVDGTLEILSVEGSPPALSHYTDAVRWGDLLFISGCVAMDHAGQVIAPGNATAQARAVHQHIDAALRAAGTDFAHVLKVTVFLTDIGDRQAVNEVRKEFFGDSLPASTLVEVGALVLPGLVVEIEAIAGISA